ncbi:MAG TPA: C40 family peptidase [Gemmatimonadales bacterium]|nr:C40 family peptidase [Gemmatimonadales bacterium]
MALAPATLAAQRRSLDLRYGEWEGNGNSRSYAIRFGSVLAGPFRNGFAVDALVGDSLGRRAAYYGVGYDLQLLRREPRTFGPYAVLGAGIGMSTDTTAEKLAALWTAGGGLEWHPFSVASLNVEVAYRAVDRGPKGFWNSMDGPRGVGATVGLTIWWKHGTTSASAAPKTTPLPAEPPVTITGNAADVVQTALVALGTPYQWGGTAENGFDCSGLVQYAYGQHGIRLPRMSRDQAKAGTEVTPVIDALVPGDVLLFSAQPGAGVTHVGMYVGEGKFIHSSSTGVRISRLEASDPEGSYWIPRWVGARRIIP